jgi:ABC-type Na+ efflux pump permease subunit
MRMAQIFQANNDAYLLHTMTRAQADAALQDQKVAAIITIPTEFDDQAARGAATVGLTLNNVDVDFADDIRRTVTMSVGQFDAPELGGDTGSRDALLLQALREVSNPGEAAARPAVVSLSPNTNPYRVGITERNTRRTTVAFLKYEMLPILILAVINIGVLGTALLCARECEGRTAKLLLLSPAARGALVGGKRCALLPA